jgi:hypothetical protein
MQINLDGVWTEFPEGEVPQTLPWDASLPYTGYGRLGDNRGCPAGYFAEYVSGPFGGTVTVCRRFDQQIASNPTVLQEETGPGFYEQTQINIASAAQAVAGGLLGGVSAIALVGLGLLAVLWLTRR